MMRTFLLAALLVGCASAHRHLLQPGSDCASQGPDNLWPCCVDKLWDGTDPSCLLANIVCGNLPEPSKTECCVFKGGFAQDNTCPNTDAPGATCASTGPDSWWSCCVAKDQTGDATCPTPNCGDLNEPGKTECCTFKGAANDPSCGATPSPSPVAPSPEPPIGSDCASRGPDNLEACCAEKAANGETDPSCVANPSPAPPRQYCNTTGPNYWVLCCKDAQAVTDPTCPAPSCGELATMGGDIAQCCYDVGGWTVDPTCATTVCYNQQQTEVNLGVVTNTFMQEVEGSDNVTQVLAAIDATFAEIRAIFMGTSANFPSTIVD